MSTIRIAVDCPLTVVAPTSTSPYSRPVAIRYATATTPSISAEINGER
jgi:hypothetical protein